MGGEHSELSMIDHGHLSCVQSIYKAGEQPLPEAGGSVGRRERSNVTFPRVILSCSFHDATQKTSAGLVDAALSARKCVFHELMS